jgi:hypothetical protein
LGLDGARQVFEIGGAMVSVAGMKLSVRGNMSVEQMKSD